jgi:hypothetical protein
VVYRRSWVRLVADHQTRLCAGPAVVHVKIGAADGTRGEPDDHVGRILDLGILDIVDTDLAGCLIHDGLHRGSLRP